MARTKTLKPLHETLDPPLPDDRSQEEVDQDLSEFDDPEVMSNGG
jgi:hypothetical protein